MRSHQGKWSASHARDWQASIENHAIKELGAVPVDEIRLEHVLRVLRPIWNTKTITAARVQNRIESLLDYATVHGHRAGENPARWTGYLSELLPAPGSIAKPDPHRALDYRDVTQFCEWLREVGTVTALSIEFLLLTATRLREVLDAEWSEIDLDAMTWVIPANRMKAGREHRVPLSTRAAAIIATMRSKTTGRWVFPGPAGKPLSNAACHQLLKGSEWVSKTTIHGLRATFRTWAADCTAFDYETIESSLAHSIGGNVERRYLRSDFFDRRRALMQAWNDYATNAETADNVVPMTRERSM
jgi:integrase